jgi:CBS domain-containing protein
MRLQLHMTATGQPVTNKVALSALSAIERSRLKDSFRAIRDWQDQASLEFHVDF